MDDIGQTKRKVRKGFEGNIDADDSDIPVHEELVKEEHIKKLKKK